MDAAEALADLKQISTQIERAVLVRADGVLEASTLHAASDGEAMARAAHELWQAADAARAGLGRPELTQLEVATPEGSVFLVRDPVRIACAVTGGDPTVGLIFYDLKTCLRNVAEDAEAAAGAADGEGDDAA